MSLSSPFASIPQAPPDPILGLNEAFNADANPKKVNLAVGVYKDGEGRVPLLKSVRKAEERWLALEDTKTYLPIEGIPSFLQRTQSLVLGSGSPAVAEGRAITVQAPGGTGALKVGADFLRRSFPDAQVWISAPSWENHKALFEAAGFQVNTYPYFDSASHSLDFDGMIAALRTLPPRSIVVLHACCHNPTGVDPTREQWHRIVEVCAQGGLIPFIDFAYQGFGDGLEEDAFAVRTFAEAGVGCLIANSYSKCFSIYRERVGALTVLTASADEASRVLSQLKRVIRTNFSNAISHGAQVVNLILGDDALRAEWEQEVGAMRRRIWGMRTLFHHKLTQMGVKRDFSFITRQKGMFSFTGLTVEEVRRLRRDYSLYVVESGRICVAAMNEGNMDYICSAIAATVKD
ncbi:MAG: aromatic amino acid transaminase [Chthonomonadales bacterium]